MTDFKCKFCNKSFKRESAFVNHMCKTKRRWEVRNELASLVAFDAYEIFYEREMKSKKDINDFIKSSYYLDFIKYGRFIVEYDIPYIHSYVHWCIVNKIKLSKWSSPLNYDEFLHDHIINKEEPEKAIERSIIEIEKWAKKENKNYYDFFREAELNEAAWMIRTGRVSPWMIYASPSAKILLDDLTEAHMKELGNIINPSVWHKKILTNQKSFSFISELLQSSGF